MMDKHTSLRVARMLGEVRLQLPQYFREELHGAIDRGLAKLPTKSRQELKDLVAASVAITLRASDFSDVMEAEFTRLREAEAIKAETMDWQRLQAVKNKHSKAVEAFEHTIYNRSSTPKAVEIAHSVFIDSICLVSDAESIPLTAWADELLSKRKKLRK